MTGGGRSMRGRARRIAADRGRTLVLAIVVTACGAHGARAARGADDEVVVAAPSYARAQYVAWRTGHASLALASHHACGWDQRTRLLPDGSTEVTVVVDPSASLGTAPWPRHAPLPTSVAPWLPSSLAPPEIRELAEEIVHGALTQAEVSARILTWVSVNVHHAEDPGHDDPIPALTSGSGSCIARSLLSVALLRAAGLPARTLHGLLVHEGSGGEPGAVELHRFVETWIDGAGWVPSDPGESVHVVDTRHVVISDDALPYDPETQRGLTLRRQGALEPLALASRPVHAAARPLVVRRAELAEPRAQGMTP